jgi:hypothetical protein
MENARKSWKSLTVDPSDAYKKNYTARLANLLGFFTVLIRLKRSLDKNTI